MLFTDVVGSTALLVAHGERYDSARRAHDAALRGVVADNGGRVVKGTGDGLMCLFDAVADGVDAARAAQRCVDRLNRAGAGPPLSIRIGVAVGDVTREGDDCFGEAVVTAARLCAAADGGVILATRVARDLLGSQSDGFEPAGPIDCKGLPEPVDAVEVLWDAGASSVPLPDRLAEPLVSFVGRHHELERLDRSFRAVADDGRRRLVLVAGEAGAGKTTVLGQAARRWHDRGAIVTVGRCEEHARAPYRPFMEALDHLVAGAPGEVLDAHLVRHGSRVAALAPRFADRVGVQAAPGPADPETERYLLFAAVADLLVSLGGGAPVVLLLEDLHWVDEASASLLRSLAGEGGPARLLVVCTFRSDEVGASHPMGQVVAALRRVEWVDRVPVGGLRREDVIALLELWTGRSGDDREVLAEWLLAQTDGNAFFVTEVMRHLDETGRLDELALGPAHADLLPDSVREVLGDRVARLGPTAESALATAAVIGAEFDLSLLSAATGLPDDKLLEILDGAGSASLVREVTDAPGRFVFAHALVQHAMLVLLGPTRIASLHRRVAEELEIRSEVDSLDELAHHWVRATQVSDHGRARDWTRRAGEVALARLAPADAVGYFRQALALHDRVGDADHETRIDLLTLLGTAERQASDAGYRETLLDACRLALAAGDGHRLIEAALANNIGTFSTFQGVDAERVAMLEAAIASGVAAPGQEALLLATLANELTYSGELDRRRALAEQALTAARTTADATLRLRVMNHVSYATWLPHNLDERVALTEDSLALVVGLEDPLLRFWTALWNQRNLLHAGRLAESDAELVVVQDLAARLGQPALQWRALQKVAARRLLAGDHVAAEAVARTAADHGTEAGAPEAGVYAKSQQMCVDWQRGALDELSRRIDGRGPRPMSARSSLCVVFSATDRHADARRILDDVASGAISDLPLDPTYVTSVAWLSDGAIRLGHRDAAAVLREAVEPLLDQIGYDGVVTVGRLRHYAGGLDLVLGHLDDAVDHLRLSADDHHGLGAPFFEARSRHLLGVALGRRGRRGDDGAAAAELDRAMELAEAHGYSGVARDVTEVT